MITAFTKTLGIFGDPIAQTLSPVMQNAALDHLKLDMVYLPFHVRPDALKAAVGAVRAFEMPGVNVTIPHKEAVIEFLDETTDEATAIGAVNTVVNKDGKLIGHNTDGKGYVRSLALETGFDADGKSIVVLGAGGAARGIIHALMRAGAASIAIVNRTVDRAEKLAGAFSERLPRAKLFAAEFDKKSLGPFVATADLIVNTTSLGMTGKPTFNPLVLSLKTVPKGAVVSDAVYRPYDTALLKSARAEGLKTHRGLGMLIHQGALGFELWTGKEAPVDVMRSAVLTALDIKTT
jgi:shikimate dehydrogenase